MKRSNMTASTINRCRWVVRAAVCGILLIVSSSANVHSQDTQIWMEIDGHLQLNKNWKYTASPDFRRLLGDGGWTRYGVKNTFSRKIKSWVAVEAGLDGYYTSDPEDADIGEVRLRLATKFTMAKYMSSIHLQKPYCYLRLEQRFLRYPEEGEDDQKTRLRLKVGGTFILKNDTLADKTWYMPWYIEGFHNFNGAAFEHNAARDRASVGIGYMISQKWRAEFDYLVQGSRNTLEHGLDRTDNIFQFKFHYFFDK